MIDAHLHADWDSFWQRVTEFADEHHISTLYVEEEFILDGELVEKFKSSS